MNPVPVPGEDDTIIFTRHATERRIERGYTEAEILAILRQPDVTYFGPDGKPNVRGRTNDGRNVRIVYVYDGSAYRVNTVI